MYRFALLGLASCSLLAAAPEAKTVPWLTADGPSAHETFAHRDITLKGTSSEAGDHIQATWDFGDGSAPYTFNVAKSYDASAKHAYFGNAGDIFEARLTLTNTRTGESSSAAYSVVMREQSPAVEVNVAIDEGLWRLHVAMHEGQRSELDRLAFETHGHSADGPTADAYTATLAAIKQARLNRAARATTLPFSEQYAIAMGQNADGSWTEGSADALMKMAKTPTTRDFGTGAVVNVSSVITTTTSNILYSRLTNTYNMTLTLKNNGATPLAGPIHVGITGLTAGITLANATGTFNAAPYILVTASSIAAGASAPVQLRFANPSNLPINFGRVTYSGAFPPAALTIGCPANTATIGSPYTSSADANGGVLNYTFSISLGSLPSPLTINPATGAITGTPSGTGPSNFTVQVTDAAGPTQQTVSANCTITVGTGNAAPTANAQSPAVQEDTPTTITLTGSDPESAALTFSIVTGPANGSLGPIVPINATSASVQYSPNGNYNGPDSFTFKVNDGSLDSSPATVSITVGAVNDPPTFTVGGTQTVLEDSGPQSVSSFITAISPGPANESAQTVSFNITGNTNAGLFSVSPSIAPNGTLTYTPAANANGSATITVTATDNGAPPATSGAQQFTITVTPVNDEPFFNVIADQNISEDAAPQTITIGGISTGPANESGQTVSFSVINSNNALFSVQPSATPAGALTYTLTPNASGTAIVTVTMQDSGGTNFGGDDSFTRTFNVNVTAVNDAPGFTVGANQTVNEDAGAQTVAGFITAIVPGPPDESSQTVSLNISGNTNAGLFSAGPAIDANGQLTYTPAANANGVATITVTATDDGTPPATSGSQQFTITVNAVNDVPSFTPGGSVAVNEDAGAQSVAWATAISKGPANESGQTVNFIVSNNNNGLFSAQPAISATGQLTYTPGPNKNGVATVTVQIHDDGGTNFGGVDTSTAIQFTITVNAINDPPVVTAKTFLVQPNIKITHGAGTLIAGTTDPNDPENVSPTFTVTAASATSGTVTFAADGSFSYDPAPGNPNDVTLNYTVCDNGTPGSACTNATATLDLAGPMIWFVNASAPACTALANNCGRLTNPFSSLAAFNALNNGTGLNPNDGHYIFVYENASGQSGAVALRSGQKLIGQDATASLATISGATPPTGSDPLPAMNSGNATFTNLTSTVTLNTNATVRGLNLSTTTNTALSGGAVTGVAVSEVNITTTTGAAVSFNGTGGNFTFGSINTTAAATALTLTNTTGTFTVNGDGTGRANGTGGTINGVTTAALTATTAGGTITLRSMNVVLNTSAVYGMLFDNNAGGTLAANLTGMSFVGVTTSINQNKSLLQFETGGSANLTPNVQNSFFNGSRTYGLAAIAAGTSSLNITVNQSGFGTQVNTGTAVNQPGTSETNAPAIYMLVSNSASSLVDYNISNNTFFGASGALGAVYGVTISGATTTAGSHLNGTISGNRMGLAASVGSGCSDGCAGIGLLPGIAGTFKSTLSNNTIRQTNSTAMNFANTVGAGASFTYGLNFLNNSFTDPDTTGGPAIQRAIAATPGNSGGASTGGCLAISGNSISGAWQLNNFIRISTLNTTGVMTIPGLGVNGATNTQVNTYVSGLNGAASVNTSVSGAINNTVGTTCP